MQHHRSCYGRCTAGSQGRVQAEEASASDPRLAVLHQPVWPCNVVYCFALSVWCVLPLSHVYMLLLLLLLLLLLPVSVLRTFTALLHTT